VLEELGALEQCKVNQTERTIYYKPSKSYFLCKGLDEPEKIKSIQGITSVWLEEATEFTHNDFTQILLRVRGIKRHYVQFILSFNPISERHWLKSKVVDVVERGEMEDWSYVHTTYKDKKFLTPDDRYEIQAVKESNELDYQVYCLGDWGVEDKTGKFAYAFDKDKHVRHVVFNDRQFIYVSFDFNVNPITCVVMQHYLDSLYVIETIKLQSSNIYELCGHIKAKYGSSNIIVTGDATGRATTAMVKDKMNYYRIIKSELELMDEQIQVPKINPPLAENRVLVNAVLQRYKVYINPDSNEALLYDLTFCEVDEDNKLVKDNRADQKQQADALDCFRYFVNKFLNHVLKSPPRYHK